MKIEYALSIRQVVKIILIYTFTIMSILVMGDMLMVPIIKEIARDSSVRNWCGFFYECSDSAMPSLTKYIYSGEFWRYSVDFPIFWIRLMKSAVLGFVFGIGWTLIIMFKR